ncbi:MAG: hypothetical protein JNM70_00725 [Anaerolineae bacterium]|nr:hypothetical protein [Anaerolineae bacterium]
MPINKALQETLDSVALVNDQDTLWGQLRRLLTAHAPSSGAWLPGAIIDEMEAIAGTLGFEKRFQRQIGTTGGAGISLGADHPQPDLVIFAHMDRPTYRVKSAGDGLLYPICANRFTQGTSQARAKALRFIDGRVQVAARGWLYSSREASGDVLRFETTEGQLGWQDYITLEVEPVLSDGIITGTGLDNCLGVITTLGALAGLRALEDQLRAEGKRILAVFTDLEEGNPEAFFGHGAARTMYAVPPPKRGCLVIDAQTVNPDGVPAMGQGDAYGSVSAWGRGSVVPPNALALAIDLAGELNAARPGTVQMNTGYLSRSDDMALSRWTHILGMSGPPMLHAHTDHETARLDDVPDAMVWLAHLAAALVSEEAARRYAVG